jgi:urease accessory protein
MSFAEGLAHPFSGLDHILAMVAVGLWASQIGGRALWLLPLTFPAVMAAGAALGLRRGVAVG